MSRSIWLPTCLIGREVLVAGQADVRPGEFYDLTGPLGVPVIVGPSGIRRIVELLQIKGSEP